MSVIYVLSKKIKLAERAGPVIAKKGILVLSIRNKLFIDPKQTRRVERKHFRPRPTPIPLHLSCQLTLSFENSHPQSTRKCKAQTFLKTIGRVLRVPVQNRQRTYHSVYCYLATPLKAFRIMNYQFTFMLRDFTHMHNIKLEAFTVSLLSTFSCGRIKLKPR